MIHTQRTIGLRVNSQARVHDMRNVQASIACIGSSLQEMQTEKSQTVVVRSTETGLVEDSTPDVGERHERNAQYGCLRSGSVVLPSFPPRESGGVVQPRRDSPAVQPQLKPVVEHDSTLKSGPFEELPIARSEWFSPGSMTRSRFKKISVPLQQHTYTTSLASVHYQLKAISLVIGSVNDGDYVDAEQQIETSISIHPKPWLLGRGFALSYRTSGENWMPHFGIQFRQYNIRSEEALIFEFCSYGNIEGVKSLLRRGDASPFDTDPDAWTPLHVCSRLHDEENCSQLMFRGVSMQRKPKTIGSVSS